MAPRWKGKDAKAKKDAEAEALKEPMSKMINGSDTGPQNDQELGHYMKSKKETFLCFYKAHSLLKMKNWVVRPGAQYGADFVVHRYHPSRVHSEYGVLVLSDGDDKDLNGRLRVWSDVHCTTRLLGSVTKILLVLYVNKNDNNNESPLCLANYTVEERTITR
ncbi:hypothetical protein JHK85_054398 [Glycine max]|nr:hypothetical protein JHK85_054398 [Glycine max]